MSMREIIKIIPLKMEPIWNINSCWVFMHFISIGSLSPSNRQGKSFDPRNIKYKTQMLNETPLADARNRTAWKSVHRFIRKQLLEILCRNGLALALICILEACFGKRFSDSDKSTPPSFSNSIWLRTRLWNCSKMERHFEFLQYIGAAMIAERAHTWPKEEIQ